MMDHNFLCGEKYNLSLHLFLKVFAPSMWFETLTLLKFISAQWNAHC